MKSAKIAIIDDESAVTHLIASDLRSLEATFFYAHNGKEAMRLFEEQSLDVILCDIVMPDLNGIDFLQMVRRKGFRNPFIVITGHPGIPYCVKALRHGAFDFIEKPWNIDQLVKTVADAIAVSGYTKQLEKSIEDAIHQGSPQFGEMNAAIDYAIRIEANRKRW